MTDSLIRQDELKRILSRPEGRAVLYDILAIAGIFRQPFSTDQRTTDFNCGSMNIGIMLHAECMLASPDFTAMMYKDSANAGRTDNSPADDAGKHSAINKRNDTAGDHLDLGFNRSGDGDPKG